jgi:23S rRNA (guanosine2251-2'-O)-methyltransferase
MNSMTETIEGRNPVIEALRAGRPINRILLANNIQRHSAIAEILSLARQHAIPVEYVEEPVFRKYSLTGNSQGVIAFTAVKDYVSLEDLLAISKSKGEAPLYCILDGIEDPQNLGAILRTAEATGFHGVIIRERRAVGLTSAVARASAGAIEYVPVARVTNITQTIEQLKKEGVWVFGIETSGKQDFNKIDYKSPTAIVIGSEGKGVSDLVTKHCDSLACIPATGRIGSLNASVAAALVMYQAFRQRHP